MSIFWKGFAIFWILFLIWYLTGGPQRVTTNKANLVTAFQSSVTESIATPSDNNDENTFNSQTQTKSDKSFFNQSKTNTINVSN